CLLGLLRAARARGLPPPDDVCEFLLKTPRVLAHVNNLAPAAAAAVAARATHRDGRRDEVPQCLTTLHQDAPIAPDADRAGERWPGGVWADTVLMAGSFLLHAGLLLENEDLVADAVRQWVAHAELLQHPESGLFAHGSHHEETIWCFWGRANAWVALAGVE